MKPAGPKTGPRMRKVISDAEPYRRGPGVPPPKRPEPFEGIVFRDDPRAQKPALGARYIARAVG